MVEKELLKENYIILPIDFIIKKSINLDFLSAFFKLFIKEIYNFKKEKIEKFVIGIKKENYIIH